jgi:hypothetical protein
MDTNLLLPALVTILLAFLGYIATYINNLRLSQRSEELARVNRQLSELYGPLFALTQASDTAWQAYTSAKGPGYENIFAMARPPTEAELQQWRLWMTTVFMPINLRIYEIVLAKSDLLIETRMPDCLLQFCAHVTAYQAVLKKWENNDYSEHLSLIEYPMEIIEYSKNSYQAIKAEQERLLGKKMKK